MTPQQKADSRQADKDFAKLSPAAQNHANAEMRKGASGKDAVARAKKHYNEDSMKDVTSADKKPQKFRKPDGTMGTRMVPADPKKEEGKLDPVGQADADIDNDGDQDIVLQGWSGKQFSGAFGYDIGAGIYLNQGNKSFVRLIGNKKFRINIPPFSQHFVRYAKRGKQNWFYWMGRDGIITITRFDGKPAY